MERHSCFIDSLRFIEFSAFMAKSKSKIDTVASQKKKFSSNRKGEVQKAWLHLEKSFRRYYQVQHALRILNWDESVYMPPGGAESRGEACAELKLIQHEILSSRELQQQILLIEEEVSRSPSLYSDWDKANIREARFKISKASSIPAKLVVEIAKAKSRCENNWRVFKKENNWRDFLPYLHEVVQLTREEARARAAANGKKLYDSLLDIYSPNVETVDLDALFGEVNKKLPELLPQIMEKQKQKTYRKIPLTVAKKNQKQLAKAIVKKLGFDFERGRLDESTHPFCGGVPRDVRLTNWYREDNFTSSIRAVIHEAGHGFYEQNLPLEHQYKPVGQSLGMPIHESQSLFFERQVGLSQEFIFGLFPLVLELFKLNANEYTERDLYHTLTEVKPGFIRVSADEVTYPAHVLLRYYIERDLMSGQLETRDIPEVWNQYMKSLLGLETLGNDREGCMQDIHWPVGLIGYFPSYLLGAMTAAQLFASLEKALPQAKKQIAQGDFSEIKQWLKKNIWSQGRFHNGSDLIQRVTGEKLNAQYFLQHLKDRYL